MESQQMNDYNQAITEENYIWQQGIACCLLVLGLLIVVTIQSIGFRAPSLRTYVFNILARIKGIPVIWIECPLAAASVLRASPHKGEFLERTFSVPSWYPVISMEAVDGPQWQAMKTNLVLLMKELPPIAELQSITQRLTCHALESAPALDSPTLAHISVAAFYEWIFNKPFASDTDMFVCDATWEWRKEIAIKGRASRELKWRVVRWILEEVKATPRLYDLFGDKWNDPEYYSLLLQPFIISPAINITDIAVSVQRVYKPEASMTDTIHVAMDTAHPFVLFERYLKHGLNDNVVSIPPGTHVFMPVDTMTTDSAIRFGAGVRKCPGAHIGMACLLGMLTHEVVQHEKFQPSVGHLYSGRDQDGQETIAETLYQAKQILYAFSNALSQWVFTPSSMKSSCACRTCDL